MGSKGMERMLKKLGLVVIDQPLDEQRKQVEDLPTADPRAQAIKDLMLSGEVCNAVAGGFGAFAKTPTNPAPVNSNRGEIRYLNRLRCKCGVGLFYHRLESIIVTALDRSVDIFETVCITGKHWDILYLDLYHPSRTKKAPAGYKMAPYKPSLAAVAVGFGSTLRVEDFPADLPDAFEQQYGDFAKSLTRKFNELASPYEYKRPKSQHEAIVDIYRKWIDFPEAKSL